MITAKISQNLFITFILGIAFLSMNHVVSQILTSQVELDTAIQSVNINLQEITHASTDVSQESKDVLGSIDSLQGTMRTFHV